jgi:hypothetical protein
MGSYAATQYNRYRLMREVRNNGVKDVYGCNEFKELKEATYQSPLRPSPLPLRESRLDACPAAADAKLDGICEGIVDH